MISCRLFVTGLSCPNHWYKWLAGQEVAFGWDRKAHIQAFDRHYSWVWRCLGVVNWTSKHHSSFHGLSVCQLCGRDHYVSCVPSPFQFRTMLISRHSALSCLRSLSVIWFTNSSPWNIIWTARFWFRPKIYGWRYRCCARSGENDWRKCILYDRQWGSSDVYHILKPFIYNLQYM